MSPPLPGSHRSTVLPLLRKMVGSRVVHHYRGRILRLLHPAIPPSLTGHTAHSLKSLYFADTIISMASSIKRPIFPARNA
jgi:hypothetical protein